MRRSLVVFALAMVAAGAGGAWAKAPVPTKREAPRATAPVAYRLAYESNAHADLGVMLEGKARAGDATAYDVAAALTGLVTARVVAIGPDATIVLVRVTGTALRVVTNGQDQTAQCEQARALLARGLLVTLARDGRLLNLRMGRAAPGFAQELFRSLAASLQFAGPGPGKPLAGHWTVREQDPIGDYDARYEVRAPVGGNLVVLKFKDAYRDLVKDEQSRQLPGRRTAVRVVKPDMTVRAQFDASGRELISLDGAETQSVTLDGRPIGQSTSRVQLIARPLGRVALSTTADRALFADLAAGPALAIFEPENPRAMEAAIQQRALGDATAVQVLAELDVAGDDDAALDGVYLKLKALAYLHPEQDGALAARLMDADAHGKPFQVLLRALAAIGDAPAQAAMASVIRHRAADAPALTALASALAGAPDPTPEAEDSLTGLAASADPGISAPALLALGGIARQLAEGAHAARSRVLVERLLAALEAASGETATTTALQALGNAGAPGIAGPVLARLTSPSPIVRAAALDALRDLAAPEIEARILAALIGDGDAHVRYEAAISLGARVRSAAAVREQVAAFAREKDDYVRGALLANLRASATLPEVRAVIEQAAAQDSSQHVRDTARAILDQAIANPAVK